MPLWILLLALFPLTGLGVLPCLFGATLVTGVAVILADRRHGLREAGTPGAGAPPARRPLGALGGAGIALGVVAVLAYVLFVVRAA